MKPLFDESNWAALEAIAQRWVGTPFAPGGAVCGPRGGASCGRMVVAILSESGLPITQQEFPDTPLNRATHYPGSVMSDLLRALPERFFESTAKDIQPGDILIIKLGIGAHHAGIALPGQRVIHSWQKEGAHINRWDEPRLTKRIYSVFRPLITTP